MAQSQVRRSERRNDPEIVEGPEAESRDLSDVDELLDRIDELLEDQDEIARGRYATMLKDWAALQPRFDEGDLEIPCGCF